jgi:hypothetical protein
MSESSRRDIHRRRADLFVVPCGPLTDADLIEWPEDEAEAAAIMAQCKRVGDEYRAMEALVPDEALWDEASMKVLTAVRYYQESHVDAIRTRDGRRVFSDGYRRFVTALAGPGKPGEGMPLALLAWTVSVPQPVLEAWLNSQADP